MADNPDSNLPNLISTNTQNTQNAVNILQTYGTIILLLVIFTVITFIWAIILLSTFTLPKYILIIGLCCLLIGQPWITIILAYIFKGKK